MSLLRYCTCTCNVLISERSVHQVTVATFARGLTCILEPVGRFAVRDTSRLLAGRELALLVKAAGWLVAWPWAGSRPCPKAALPPFSAAERERGQTASRTNRWNCHGPSPRPGRRRGREESKHTLTFKAMSVLLSARNFLTVVIPTSRIPNSIN